MHNFFSKCFLVYVSPPDTNLDFHPSPCFKTVVFKVCGGEFTCERFSLKRAVVVDELSGKGVSIFVVGHILGCIPVDLGQLQGP